MLDLGAQSFAVPFVEHRFAPLLRCARFERERDAVGVERDALVVTGKFDETVLQVTKNLARAMYETAGAVDVYTLLTFRTVVCSKEGFDALVKRLAVKEAK